MFTTLQKQKLRENSRNLTDRGSLVPCVYILDTATHDEWLLTDLDQSNPNVAYGLSCSHDRGTVETGRIDLSQFAIEDVNPNVYFNDISFQTAYNLKVFKLFAEEFGFFGPGAPGPEEKRSEIARSLKP